MPFVPRKEKNKGATADFNLVVENTAESSSETEFLR